MVWHVVLRHALLMQPLAAHVHHTELVHFLTSPASTPLEPWWYRTRIRTLFILQLIVQRAEH